MHGQTDRVDKFVYLFYFNILYSILNQFLKYILYL